MDRSLDRARRLPPAALAACAVVLALAWLAGHELFATPLLATYAGEPALAPLYAFASPLYRLEGLLFPACAVALVLLAARAADPARTTRGLFQIELALCAVLLPLTLFLVRGDAGDLGRQFLVYRHEEFFQDALAIDSLAVFLDRYVESMPALSLHGRHFPPGNAVVLHLVQQAFGTGPLAAGVLVLACFAAAVLVVARAIEAIAGEARARQAALLCLAAPSLLDFACTSMDAVFLLAAAVAWALALRVFAPAARRDAAQPGFDDSSEIRAGEAELGLRVQSPGTRTALACGVALFVATCFSFSALPLGLWIIVHALVAGRRETRATVRRLALVGASYAVSAIFCELATGFSLLDCLFVARKEGLALMEHASGGSPYDHHASISYGNLVAFLVGSGLALATAAGVSLCAPGTLRSPLAVTTLVLLAVVTAGGIYFLETERIWLFAMPWLAALAVVPGPWDARSLRVLLVAGLAQAWIMETTLFTLW